MPGHPANQAVSISHPNDLANRQGRTSEPPTSVGAAGVAPPGDATPAASLAARRLLFPNTFSRPIRLPTVGVLGVCGPASLPLHPPKSSEVAAAGVDAESDGRRPRREK